MHGTPGAGTRHSLRMSRHEAERSERPCERIPAERAQRRACREGRGPKAHPPRAKRSEALGQTAQHQMEVHRLEHVELEPPGAFQFLRGVDERERERLTAFLLVVEFRHQHVAIVRDDRAGGIAVVDRFRSLARDERAEVVHRDRDLLADGG